ncbi:MAG: hypothetical protein WBL67_18940 [Nitrososphaeraceae archaeon]
MTSGTYDRIDRGLQMLHEINDKNFITPYEQFAGAPHEIRIKKT